MTGLVPIRRALLSVSDKTDIVAFARGLVELGVEIVSTGGTAAALSDAGIDVVPIDAVTGFPEMMDGRVKTLHPSVHGAVLGRRDLPAHVEAMREHGITPIDLVCINLYPFERTIARADATTAAAVEQIDIGGPALLRSSAKNHDFVTVVTSASQYDQVIEAMRRNDGATPFDLRRDLAAAAFTRTAEYDTAISAWMCSRREDAFPALLRLSYAHQEQLRYGENPHQRAALYSNPASRGPNVVTARRLHGKALSYNNILDAAAALALVQDLDRGFPGQACATLIKHTNACGAAVSDTLDEAFRRAYAGDELAAFGGILAVNRPVDDATADAIADGQKFLEVIVAPEFEATAAARLGERWQNVRLLATGPFGAAPPRKIDYRSIPGGMLVQERDLAREQYDGWTVAAGPEPTDAMRRDAGLAWLVVKHLHSNAIAIVADGQLLGAGVGQVDRVTACGLAVTKAGDRGAGAAPVAASDAFFPFPDGPERLIDAGVRVIVQPGGSKRDAETLALCDARGVTCLLTGMRHFRH